MSRAGKAGGWATVAEVAAERITARRVISTAVAIVALVIGGVPAQARTTPHPLRIPSRSDGRVRCRRLDARRARGREPHRRDDRRRAGGRSSSLRAFADQDAAARRRRRRPARMPKSHDDRAVLDELGSTRSPQADPRAGCRRDRPADRRLHRVVKERNKLDDAALRQALAQQGLTWEQYRRRWRSRTSSARRLINKEIRNKVNVSPEEIERYLQEHLTDYGTPAKAPSA